MTKAGRVFWQALLAANLAIILWYWWQGSGSTVGSSLAETAIAFGRLAGLLAAATVLTQFMFMGRAPYLERVFGLDKLSRIHHLNGQYSIILLLVHPMLLTYGYSRLTGVSLVDQFVTFITDFQYVIWALVALILLLIVVGTSIVIVRRHFRYESWYVVHLLVYGAVFAAIWHQVTIGTDILSSRFFYGYWLALYAAILGSHVLFRFIRQWYLFNRHQFFVARVVRENHNVTSIYISGKQMDRFSIEPGQFMIFRFLTRGRWWQAHPFSLSRMPNGQEIRITVKAVGDFTKELPNVPVGTKVVIDGPFGIFTEGVRRSPKILFIAGGIGITPIRSLFERLIQKKHDITLLYGNRTEEDIVFRSELEKLVTGSPAKIQHVISDQADFAGEKGRIDKEKIAKLVPDVAERDVYLCGPIPMMNALIPVLQSLGVPRSRIHYEKFSLAV